MERLTQLSSRQLKLTGPRYQVRAIVEPAALPVLSPLVIADRHVFFGRDDERLFLAGSGMYVYDRRAAAWVLNYFDDLWEGASYVLRDSVGPRPQELSDIELAVRALERSAAHLAERREPFLRRGRHASASINPQALRLPPHQDLAELLSRGEGEGVEYKGTLPVDLATQQVNHALEDAVIKTVCGFLNAWGGVLLIGVADDGAPLGLGADYASSPKISGRDGFIRHLTGILERRIGQATVADAISVDVERFGPFDIGRVTCRPAKEPVFIRSGTDDVFWVRRGSATSEMGLSAALTYFKHRWPG